MRQEKVIVRNPHSTRPYQHVLEPLAVYLKIAALQYENREYEGCYNVGPDDIDCVCTSDLVTMFCKAWGDGMDWENRYDGGPHEANFLKLDCSKIKKKLNWKPRYHVNEAVLKTVEWSKAYCENQNMQEVTRQQIREFFE